MYLIVCYYLAMAGYLFLIDKIDAENTIKRIFQSGIFSPNVPIPDGKGNWRQGALGAFGDIITMSPNDFIFFFSNRMIYGVGKAVSLDEGFPCVFKNYPEASIPHSLGSKNEYLVPGLLPEFFVKRKLRGNRWFCTFEPAPDFYAIGVDMDDLLTYSPERIRMLRVMEKVSFTKIDDDEADAIVEFISLRVGLSERDGNNIETLEFNSDVHDCIRAKLKNGDKNLYYPQAKELVSLYKTNKNTVSNEMALEVAILQMLHDKGNEYPWISDDYDFVSQQIPASPFKPVAYLDRIDVFAYSYLVKILEKKLERPVKGIYLILELKKNMITSTDTVHQIMKYVDFVAKEYTGKDYSRIKAGIIASAFSEDVIISVEQIARRNYTLWMRPSAESRIWNMLSLIRYRFDEKSKYGISLELIHPSADV